MKCLLLVALCPTANVSNILNVGRAQAENQTYKEEERTATETILGVFYGRQISWCSG
jgi:hypothetical protein